jgi:hypothetical protein
MSGYDSRDTTMNLSESMGLWEALVVLGDFATAEKCFVSFVSAESTCCGVSEAGEPNTTKFAVPSGVPVRAGNTVRDDEP